MRPVDANDLFREIACSYVNSAVRIMNPEAYKTATDILNRIEKQPIIDPVSHSKWVWNPEGYDLGIGGWACERCGHVNGDLPHENPPSVPIHAFAASHYCNCCGAKMDEKADQESFNTVRR